MKPTDNLAHDEQMARFQRLLDRLQQVTKQAKDLARFASELQDEASESIQLVKTTARHSRKSPRKRKRPA